MHTRYTLAATLSLILSTMLSCTSPTTHTQPNTPTKPTPTHTLSKNHIQRILQNLAQDLQATGASVTVSTKTQTLHTAHGTTHPNGSPVTSSTPFNIQSTSKLFTAAKIHTLASQDTLSLNDPLSAHIPNAHITYDTIKDLPRPIHIRDLLQHTSGLPTHPPNFDPTKHGVSWRDADFYSKLFQKPYTIQALRVPGSYIYSNLNYGLLGAIIERAESCNFADCMQPYLQTLQLPTASFHTPSKPAAHGQTTQNNTPTSLPPSWYTSPYAAPFGGLWISSKDLAQFGLLLLKAHSDPTHPLHPMTQPPNPEKPAQHGLGPVFSSKYGPPAFHHDGSGPGFLSALVVIPKHSTVIALTVNAGRESKTEARTLNNAVQRIIAHTTAHTSK